MTGLGAWLMAAMAPLAGRLLVALGFQVVTITGMAASITAVKTIFLQHMSSVPAAGSSVLNLILSSRPEPLV